MRFREAAEGIELVERTRGQAERGTSGLIAKHLGEHSREWRCGRLAHGLIERGQRQRFPQHLPQTRGLAVVDQPLFDRLTGRGRNPCGLLPGALCSEPCLRSAKRPRQSEGRDPIFPAQRVPLKQPAEQVEWSRQDGHCRRLNARRSTRRRDRLAAARDPGSDRVQKPERLVVTPAAHAAL